MKNILLVFTAAIVLSSLTFAAGNSDKKTNTEQARELVKKALEEMGGEDKIRALSNLKIEGIGHSFAVEQSERPAGPFLVAYQQIKETRDLSKNRLRREAEGRQFQLPDWTSFPALIVADDAAAYARGERTFPGRPQDVESSEMQIALAPERIFLTAFDATDLSLDRDVILQDVSQHQIKFTWKNSPVTIYLNANTNLPTAIETLTALPYDYFWSIWGDLTTRTYYSLWNLETGGIRYPYQKDIERNGYPLGSLTITKLTLNVPLDENSFEIPDETRKLFAANKSVKIDDLPLGVPDRPAKEIAPGIIEVQGNWNFSYVKQADGIVIIEAPISSGYSAKVIEETKRRFPNEKIKAVVTTSDAFPHLGGVREYAAQGVPIYALDLNRPILERIIKAEHKFYPDNLEQNPRKANFTFVSKKTVIGEGANKVELYPIRTETGDRMMMIYFPEKRLLYASDLVQKNPDDSFFIPQYLAEIMDAVKRENLTVENLFAMHSDIIPWKEITEAVAKQRAEAVKETK